MPMQSKKQASVTAKIEVAIKCPCGGEVQAGYMEGGMPLLIHTIPTCKTFVMMAPDKYLEWVRKGLS